MMVMVHGSRNNLQRTKKGDEASNVDLQEPTGGLIVAHVGLKDSSPTLQKRGLMFVLRETKRQACRVVQINHRMQQSTFSLSREVLYLERVSWLLLVILGLVLHRLNQQGTEIMRNMELSCCVGFDSTWPWLLSQTCDRSKLVLFNGTGTGRGTVPLLCCFLLRFLLVCKSERRGRGSRSQNERRL